MVALFIEEPTPFIQEFFDAIANLDYLKSRISLFVHAAVRKFMKLLDYSEQIKSPYVQVSSLHLSPGSSNPNVPV